MNRVCDKRTLNQLWQARALLETRVRDSAEQGVEIVSAFSELASNALGDRLVQGPSLLTLARRQFTGIGSYLLVRDTERVIDYRKDPSRGKARVSLHRSQ